MKAFSINFKKNSIETIFILFFLSLPFALSAKSYYVAVNGNDSNNGTLSSPFATLAKAQSLVEAGDTVFIRGGTYQLSEEQIMSTGDLYVYVFDMGKSGLNEDKRIYYWGYANERPIFDLSAIKPPNKRVSVFYVTGSYLHFKNFEILGTQVSILDHTQSECISNRGGNNNIYENLAMHDGMGIGFYLTKGSNNLILNCDAYNNYDPVSEGGVGGNVDGFGGHPSSSSSTGNIFKGCRAWYNSDDGFDLINAFAAVTIDHCWSFRNGYKPETSLAAGDGTGFKAGGYGMSENPKVPAVIPQHSITHCIAYNNKNNGFYANHHLGGIAWYNNTAYKNAINFCMKNRKSVAEAVDVPGYDHIIKNNISYLPRSSQHIIDVDVDKCFISNNSFFPKIITVGENDFISLDETQLKLPRNTDGNLPYIGFLNLRETSELYKAGMGYSVEKAIISYDWMLKPAIVVEDATARVVGPDAEQFTQFLINDQEVDFSFKETDLSLFTGTLELKAITPNGDITKVKINR